MNRFLKRVLFFSGVLIVTYPVLIVACGSWVPQLFRPNIAHKLGAYGFMHSRIAEIKDSISDVDVLFLGSSHAYRGFDTRNFEEVSSFNLGSSAQSPLNTQVLLKRYLEKLNPGTVVYEVFPGSLSGDGVESALDIISNDRNDAYSFSMIRSAGNIKVYNTFIYALFRDLFSLNDGFKDRDTKEDKYISRGFVQKKLNHFRYLKYADRYWELNPKQLEAFSDNLELLREKNIKVILVFAPITSRLYQAYKNNAYINDLMNGFGLDYYNFNELMQLDDSLHFYDSHHLNQTGVNLFNARLKELVPGFNGAGTKK